MACHFVIGRIFFQYLTRLINIEVNFQLKKKPNIQKQKFQNNENPVILSKAVKAFLLTYGYLVNYIVIS